MRSRLVMIAVALVVTASAPPRAAAGIGEWCEGTWLSDDVFMPNDFDWQGWDEMHGNDIYLRWAAAQYVGHDPNDWRKGLHVLGWVSAKNQAGVRDLWVAMVQDFDPSCMPLHGTLKLPPYVNDVNWVHRGGFVPAGHSETVWYPPHGYLVWSGAGTQNVKADFSVARFGWQGGLSYQEVYHQREGILPSMASNRPFHFNRDIARDTMSTIGELIACYAPALCKIFNCPPCDSGQRLLSTPGR